jgi:aryl-alcohol dehydrogenase-like predicted oxidoreductase
MKERHVHSLQIIYSILEQEPARQFFPIAEKEQVGLLSRVPHASEALTGRYTEPPTFQEGDHRSHRRVEWLREALQKVEKVKFLAGEDVGRALSQAAIQFCLYQPTIVSVLPNFTTLDELRDYTAAVDTPSLSDQEQARLDDLWDNAFDLAEPAPQFREV